MYGQLFWRIFIAHCPCSVSVPGFSISPSLVPSHKLFSNRRRETKQFINCVVLNRWHKVENDLSTLSVISKDPFRAPKRKKNFGDNCLMSSTFLSAECRYFLSSKTFFPIYFSLKSTFFSSFEWLYFIKKIDLVILCSFARWDIARFFIFFFLQKPKIDLEIFFGINFNKIIERTNSKQYFIYSIQEFTVFICTSLRRIGRLLLISRKYQLNQTVLKR